MRSHDIQHLAPVNRTIDWTLTRDWTLTCHKQCCPLSCSVSALHVLAIGEMLGSVVINCVYIFPKCTCTNPGVLVSVQNCLDWFPLFSLIGSTMHWPQTPLLPQLSNTAGFQQCSAHHLWPHTSPTGNDDWYNSFGIIPRSLCAKIGFCLPSCTCLSW